VEQKRVKFVLLTRDGLEHCYVANRLASECALHAIIVDQGKPTSRPARLRLLLKRYTWRQLCSRLVGRVLSVVLMDSRRRKEEMFRVLGRAKCERHLHESLLHCVHGINSDESCRLIEGLKPDVILVYGTSVVGDRVLSLAGKNALNMHTGIAPQYRGADCAFWPLYNNEPGLVGATIHQCTNRIDGGMIYRTAPAPLDADDSLFSVFARSVKVGADLYVDAVRNLADGTLHGTAQELDKGREYKAAMKSWWKEMTVRRKIRRGLIKDYVSRRLPGGASAGPGSTEVQHPVKQTDTLKC
jgi:methionyl-tRNA formyltransferase